MASNTAMIHKLQNALNLKGHKILHNTTQFYSEEQNRAVTKYHVKKCVFDPEKQKNVNLELFSSTSQIQIVLFLRDLWCEVNGKPVPQDNEDWNIAKSIYQEKHKK
jgi:hypothetical protein